MPDALLNNRITEALAATGGDNHDAQKLLITWAVRDHALLLEMTKPHLKAIAAGLVDHAVRSRKDGPEKTAGGFSKRQIDDLIVSAINPTPAKRKRTDLPPPKSTERQASTMRQLAEAFSKKNQ
jgi:hypothetical protein